MVFQAARDWRSYSVRKPLGHSVCCAALGLDISYDRKQNQRAHIWRRHQQGFEIAEYSDGSVGRDIVRLYDPVEFGGA